MLYTGLLDGKDFQNYINPGTSPLLSGGMGALGVAIYLRNQSTTTL